MTAFEPKGLLLAMRVRRREPMKALHGSIRQRRSINPQIHYFCNMKGKIISLNTYSVKFWLATSTTNSPLAGR
jgi:hypothetical protein